MDCIYETESFFFSPSFAFLVLFFSPDLVLREHRKKKERKKHGSLAKLFFSAGRPDFCFFSFFFWTFEFRLFFGSSSRRRCRTVPALSPFRPQHPLYVRIPTHFFLKVCEGKQKKKKERYSRYSFSA